MHWTDEIRSRRGRGAALVRCRRELVVTLVLGISAAGVAEAARVTVYTDREAFLQITEGIVATEGGGGAAGELPWRGEIDAKGDDVLVGDIRFRAPDGGSLFLGTDSIHGDWTPWIPGPDLAPPAAGDLEVGLVNPVGRVHAMGVDLAAEGESSLELEIYLLAGDETVYTFGHVVPPGRASFLGVWSEIPFEALRIRQAAGDGTGHSVDRALLGPVYVSEATFTPGTPRTLTPSDSDSATFGASVAVHGDVVAVGAPSGNEAGAQSGSAYVFERDAGGVDNWGEVKHLLASDGEAFDELGTAVGVSGDVVVVGARNEDELASEAGAAYVFHRDEGGIGNWGETRKLMAGDGAQTDRFGSSVAVSGDVIVVGSPGDDNPAGGSGSAYVFERNFGGPDNWGEAKKLRPDTSTPGITWATSVAVTGQRIVVGAHGSTAGTLYVFERDAGGPGNWGQVDELTSSDTVAGEGFGRVVAIHGDLSVGGAPDHEHGGIDSGSAYVFERRAGGWIEVEELLPPDPLANGNFGNSVSVGGDVILVGFPHDDDHGGASGSASFYERDASSAGDWSWVDEVTDPSPDASDQFGSAVGVSGDVAVVGAPAAGTDGRAIVFGLTGPCSATTPTGLVLTGPTVTTTELFEACYTIEALSEFGVGTSGDVTLRAGRRVVLGDGFAVGSGGSLVVEIDPAVGQ